MNKEEKYVADGHDDGSYVVKKGRKSNILAFIICVLIAFFIWAYTSAGNNGGGDMESETLSTVSGAEYTENNI